MRLAATRLPAAQPPHPANGPPAACRGAVASASLSAAAWCVGAVAQTSLGPRPCRSDALPQDDDSLDPKPESKAPLNVSPNSNSTSSASTPQSEIRPIKLIDRLHFTS